MESQDPKMNAPETKVRKEKRRLLLEITEDVGHEPPHYGGFSPFLFACPVSISRSCFSFGTLAQAYFIHLV